MKQKKYSIIIGNGKDIERLICKESSLLYLVQKFIDENKQLLFVTLDPR